MSDGHGHEQDDAAGAHDDHGFDGEPAKELGPDEPMTPGWVPLVGAALFALAGVFLIANRDAEPGSPAGAATATAPAAQQPAKQMVATALAQPRPQAAPARPGATGSSAPAIRKLTPDEVKDASRRLREAQQKKEAEGAK